MADPEPLEIRDNPVESRYEAIVAGQIALIAYILTGANITFTHTEVPAELEGHGIASQLARFVLDDARSRGLKVIPRCPFVSGYIQRHREYQDLVFGHGQH